MTSSSGQNPRPTTRPATGRSLAAAAYTFTVVMMGTTMPTPLYPTLSAAFGFGDAATTVLFAVYAIGVVAGLVIFGRLSETLGRRPVLAVALVLSMVSALLFLVAGWPTSGSGASATGGSDLGLVLMYIGRVLSGLAAGIFTSTGTVTVMENAPVGRETLAGAVATAANIGGLGLGVLMAGVVASWVGGPLTSPFIVHAVLLALAAVLLPTVRDRVTRDRAVGWLPRPQVPGMPAPARRLFAAALPGTIAGYTVCGLYSSVAPNFMANELGISSAATIGLVAGSLFIASAAGQIVLRDLSNRTLMAGGTVLLILCAALLVAAVEVGTLPLLMASSIVGGIGQGMVLMTGIRALTSTVEPGERTAVTTSFFIVGYLSLTVPAMLAGLLTIPLGLVGSTVAFCVVTVLLAAAGLVLAGRFGESRPR
ncbi:MAG: MFS transporter [Mycobacteriaceae bacterium]|uniref:MFS transporter n=1 Tax=Corynebacterium sp. TaxID=1720 RepID=UPI003F9774C0